MKAELVGCKYRPNWCANFCELFDNHLEICEELHVDAQLYENAAKEYHAELVKTKFIRRPILLFQTKKDAKRFIKEFIEQRVIPMLKFLDG